MREAVLKADYDLCDRENSNLRRHLLWAAQRLAPDDLTELRAALRDKAIGDGGIVGDHDSEDRAAAMEVRRLALKLADIADSLVSSPRTANLDRLAGRMDDTANALRNALGPEPAHTLSSFLQVNDNG